jgi:hypothetical protein
VIKENLSQTYGLQSTPIRRPAVERDTLETFKENFLVENAPVVNDRKVEKVDSTRRVADELAQTGVPQGTVVLAKEQALGRG